MNVVADYLDKHGCFNPKVVMLEEGLTMSQYDRMVAELRDACKLSTVNHINPYGKNASIFYVVKPTAAVLAAYKTKVDQISEQLNTQPELQYTDADVVKNWFSSPIVGAM